MPIENQDRGASLLELALALPFLLMAAVGIFEVGYPLHQKEKVMEAARHVGEIVAAEPANREEDDLIPCADLESEALLRSHLDPYLTSANLNPRDWEIESSV